MMVPASIVVPPSIPRLLTSFLVVGSGLVGGLLVIFGPGPVQVALASAVGGLVVLASVAAVVLQRPRVVITPEGFTVYTLFGEGARRWRDIHGEFAVIRIGWVKAVGYNLTTGNKARAGYSGYGAAITGAYGVPAERLAELLNAQAKQYAGPAAGGVKGEGGPAEPSAAADRGGKTPP